MLLASDDNSNNDFKDRNVIGRVIYSQKDSYDTERQKDDKTSGWIADEFKEQVKAGDKLVIFHREGTKKFYVIVNKTSNFDMSAKGYNPKHSWAETVTHVTLIPFLEIDDGEQQYRGKPRPSSLAEFEIDFPNKSERLDINNIPKEGLPLGEFESNGIKSPFYYPLRPEDTLFQSWIIDGPQGKGKTNFVKLMLSSVYSKTNYAQVILDREGEYTNFAKFDEMSDEGKKFFTKHGLKPVKSQVLTVSDNDRFQSTASMSMHALDYTDVLMLSKELPPASAEAAVSVFQIAQSRLLEQGKEVTFENLRQQVFTELENSSYYTGMAGKEIKNAIERALTGAHLELFDQKGKIPLTPENLFNENTVTVIDVHTLSPARQRMMILYLLLVLQRYKFQESHDEPGVLVYLDESEYIFPKSPLSMEKDQVHRIVEMIQEPVNRGRKHKYGLVSITHSISRMTPNVVDLCNTKLIFGRTVSAGKIWFDNNIGKDRTKELAYLQQGQAIIDTRQTSIPINTTLHIPFVGKKEDYFGDVLK